MIGLVVLSAAAALQLIAHSANASPAIVITDARVRPVPASLPMTAGYFTMRNTAATPDTLVSAKCDCAAEVSAHETNEMGGMSSMRASGTVAIPAYGSVVFTPGGRHLMLMGVKGGVKPGQTVRMTLTFAHAGKITAPFAGRN